MKKFYLGFILLVIISCNKQVDYSKDINELKSQISLLQGQIGGLRKTTDSLTNELKGINIQVSDISRKVDSILNRITVINTQLIDLNSQLSKNSTDITGLIKKIEDLQNELINLTKLIQDLKYQQIATSGYEIVPVDSRLKSDGTGVITVPVIILNYLPTTDNILLDRYKVNGSNGPYMEHNKYTLERAKTKILTEKIIEKRYIEQGTRFHDYGTNTIKPYINIDVVAYINVSDIKYIVTGSSLVDTANNGIKVKMNFHTLDFNELLTRVNLKKYVEEMGVKEVWFTSFIQEIGSNAYNVPESNMAGPYGNISNGGQPNIPVYNKTYVMYGFNGWRGVDTDLHNRGHQIESQMKEIDINTWQNFTKGNAGIITHWAPNSKNSGEYGNKESSKSDIMTWKPSGGTFIDVNVYTWLNKIYKFESEINMISPAYNNIVNINYNNDISYPNPNQMLGATTEIKYHVFWWQSIPGFNNNIEDNGKKINNWWDIFYNWDDTKLHKKKLIY
jgi:uncharacterized protein YoxC